MDRISSEKIDSYWSEKSRQKGPAKVRWWEFPAIIRHVNQIVCGRPVDGLSKGLQVELKKLRKTFGHGVSVGCGEGGKEFELMKDGIVRRFTLFELSTERCKRAREQAESLGLLDRVELIQGDCFSHEFQEKVDFVHWNNSLHHMLDTKTAVKWSFDILSSGGVFYMDDFVGPTRFQWSDEALKLGTRIRKILPRDFLRNPHRKGTYLPKELRRPSVEEMKSSDPSEAADSSNIIKNIKQYFPNARIKFTGGLVYHATLNDVLHNVNESDEKDKAILELLLIIDELSLNSGVESQYATALAIKDEGEAKGERPVAAGSSVFQNVRRVPARTQSLAAGLVGRRGRALLTYCLRPVPSRVRSMIPVRLRYLVRRLLK